MAQPTSNQLKATDKAYSIRDKFNNDDIVAKELNISKVTFYTRLKKSNWKNTEIVYIEYLFNPELNSLIKNLNIL